MCAGDGTLFVWAGVAHDSLQTRGHPLPRHRPCRFLASSCVSGERGERHKEGCMAKGRRGVSDVRVRERMWCLMYVSACAL
jgi:hypothetical protein